MRAKFPALVPFLSGLLLMTVSAGVRAAESGEIRYGLGINLNRADVRFELNSDTAIDGYLGFDFLGGNDTYFDDTTTFELGGYYVHRMTRRAPVGLSLLGGMEYSTVDEPDGRTSGFTIFGGLGCEYYLPGTEKLSLEGQIGLGLHFLSRKIGRSSGNGMQLTLGDLTGGILMLRYYFN